eukprot:jgi/Ulvmu1/10892/UM007_0069.1
MDTDMSLDLSGLLDDDFENFLADLSEEPFAGIPDASIPSPDMSFVCDAAPPLPSQSTAVGLSASHGLDTVTAPPQHSPLQRAQAAPEQPVDPKLEKLRAKNRRGQARYREKCKKQRQELEAKIAALHGSLSCKLTRARHLRDSRSALVGRIKTANATAPTPPAPPPAPLPPAAFAPLIRSTFRNCSIFSNDLVPPRHFLDFPHVCPISYEDVAAHMPTDVPCSQADPHGVMDALQSFLRATAARLGSPPSEICFFIQLPFEVPAPAGAAPTMLPLSHSAGVTSAPCCLSMTVAFLTLSIEATFLVREHAELLEVSATKGAAGADAHTALEEERVPVDHFDEEPVALAPLPDAAAARNLVLRCGVGKTCALHDAVAALLPPLLRRYRRSLPHAVWRRVCMQAMHIVQGTLDDMSAKAGSRGGDREGREVDGGESCESDGADASGAGEDGGAGRTVQVQEREMCWTELDVAMKVAMEVMLHYITAAMHEPAPQGLEQVRTLEATKQRIFDAMVTPSISCRMLFQYAPVAIRRMFLTERDVSCPPAEMQRLQNKVFKYLRLSNAQKADLAARWRTWFRRRFSLDRDFARALAGLQNTLPGPDDIPLPLLKAVAASCNDTQHAAAAAGAATAAAAVSASSGAGSAGSNSTHTHEQVAPAHSTQAGGRACAAHSTSGGQGVAPHAAHTASSGVSCCSVRNGLAITSVISHPIPVPPLYDDASSAPPAEYTPPPQPPAKARRGGGRAAAAAAAAAPPAEGGGSGVLGTCGEAVAAVEAAMEQVAHVHEMDSYMHHEFVSVTSLPTWVLTEVQQARMVSAYLELGVSTIDLLWMFQVAATEERWATLTGW